MPMLGFLVQTTAIELGHGCQHCQDDASSWTRRQCFVTGGGQRERKLPNKTSGTEPYSEPHGRALQQALLGAMVETQRQGLQTVQAAVYRKFVGWCVQIRHMSL